MLSVYEKIVGLTDDVCDKHLNSEYRDLARAMTRVLCRKRPSPLTSGQPRTWACGIVYVLGRINFLGDKSITPCMTTADLCAAFEVGESTVHAKSRVIEETLGTRPLDPRWTLPSFAEKNPDRKSTRLNSSHITISYAVFCLKKKKNHTDTAINASTTAKTLY